MPWKVSVPPRLQEPVLPRTSTAMPAKMTSGATDKMVGCRCSTCSSAEPLMRRPSWVTVPVTMWVPTVVAEQLAASQVPSGAIEKLVGRVKSPRPVPSPAKPSTVYPRLPPTTIDAWGGWSSKRASRVERSGVTSNARLASWGRRSQSTLSSSR